MTPKGGQHRRHTSRTLPIDVDGRTVATVNIEHPRKGSVVCHACAGFGEANQSTEVYEHELNPEFDDGDDQDDNYFW